MIKVSLSLFCGLLLGFAAQSTNAQGLADTPANRQVQVDRYMQAVPTKEMLATMTKAVLGQIPAGPQHDKMEKMLTTGIDMDAINHAQKDALVKHMTADELKALADFYSTPAGKSAMSKMGDVMADLQPMMQAQIMKAVQAAMANP